MGSFVDKNSAVNDHVRIEPHLVGQFNLIPDDCEPALADDCNRNGLSDVTEIALGLGDLDGNGLLDACEIALQTKTVPLDRLIPGKYYRAPSLRIVSPLADSLELEYEGTLEQAAQVQGPWTPVP